MTLHRHRPFTRILRAHAPASFASLFALTGIAGAQEKPGQNFETDTPIVLESFVVTGSNIARSDQEQTLPVTVFASAEIEARDSTTPFDLLIAVPQITNIPANETSTNAVAARGDNANVALRGLGASKTLVLLNGRRLPFHPFNTSSVNVNTLPTFGVQQIEVLRDGASAVYGSDAVAGVVNYVTRKDPNGDEVGVRFGATEHGGGMDVRGHVSLGRAFAEGKGSLLLNLTAYYRDSIRLRERDYSRSADKSALARAPWNVPGSAYDDLSNITVWTQFRLGAGVKSGAVRAFYPLDGNPSTPPSLTTTALPRSLYSNFNDYLGGQPQSARYSLYNRVEYELSPSVRAFGEINSYYSESRTNRQPMALSSSDAVVTLSADNPFNPFGSRFYAAAGAPNADGTPRLNGTPQPITIASVLFPEGGPENIVTSDLAYRVLAGLKGGLGVSTWNWETGFAYGGVKATDSLENSIRESKLKEAALRTDATAWNPFGYTFKVSGGSVVADAPYTNPQSVQDYYTQSLNRRGQSSIASVDARIGGEVVELWAGPIATSYGVEWRREYKEDTKDPFAGTNPPDSGLDPQNNDFITTSPKFNYDASRTISSGYAEALVPLAAPSNHWLLLHSLELNASARYERYSDFGSTTKPKLGLSWKPLRSVLVRASINEGFSAPDLADLYQPTSFGNAGPPGSRDTVRNNYLLSAGQGADVLVLNKTYSIGNPDLQPEESRGKSIGVVIDVPKVKGLSVAVDYWEIKQNNLINSLGRDAALDAELLLEYTQQQLAAGKPIEQINVGSRTAPTDTAGGYVGDPNTLRAPVTDADRALFAQTWAVLPKSQWTAALGQWIGGSSTSINSAGTNFANGLDYSVSYSLPPTAIGQFRFTTEWSQFIDKYTQDSPTAPINDDIVALTTARGKGTATIQWWRDAWSASLSAAYTGAVATGATTTQAVYDALGHPDYIRVVTNNGSTSYTEIGDDQIQLNLGVTYRFGAKGRGWLNGTSVRLGINNLLDDEPTLSAGNSGYSGSTGSSLWVGRAYSIDLRKSF